MMRIRKPLIVVVGVALISAGFLVGRTVEKKGTPDSSSAPGVTSSYTLEDIYDRLASGADGTQVAFAEPTVGPGTGTMRTLNDIIRVAPARDDGNGATTADVAAGKEFWGLNVNAGQWGLQIGEVVTQSIDDTTVDQAAGYYVAFDLSAEDGDLTTENIKDGETIFGVTGTYTCPPCPERFTDNGDGTITDNQTKLMWTKNANHGERTWDNARSYSDGYTLAGYIDWHLPDVWELFSLVDRRNDEPALPDGHPFENVPTTDVYWAQTWADDPSMEDRNAYAFIVGVYHPGVSTSYRLSTFTHYVWPVRSLP